MSDATNNRFYREKTIEATEDDIASVIVAAQTSNSNICAAAILAKFIVTRRAPPEQPAAGCGDPNCKDPNCTYGKGTKLVWKALFDSGETLYTL